ncbi:MAG: hypothetical protein AAGG48_16475 [Planctomycetota bacterium]
MSSVNLNDENAVEMPENYMIPDDVVAVGNWMNQSFSFIPQCNFNILNPPPPPPLPDVQQLVAELTSRFQQAQLKHQTITKDLLRCTQECDKCPPDRKYWEMVKQAHRNAIDKVHKELQTEVIGINQLLSKVMGMDGSENHKPALRAVYDGIEDLEYDVELDQFRSARDDMENRLSQVEETCKQPIIEMKKLEKDFFDLYTNAKGDLPYESWHPGMKRNQFAALMSRYGVLMDQLPKARTTEAAQAWGDLQNSVSFIRKELTEMLSDLVSNKKLDYNAQAKEFAQKCQEVILACDSQDFPINDWNPLTNAKNWNKLTVSGTRLKNETKLLKDKKEIDLALGVYDDLYEILCEQVAKVKNQKDIENMLAGDVLKVDAQIKSLDADLTRVGGLADTHLQQAGLVLQGVNCETNEQRKGKWNDIDTSYFEVSLSDVYENITQELQRLSKAMPWMPEQLKTVVSQFSNLSPNYSTCELKVNKAFEFYEQHKDEINNFDSDIDLGELAGIGANADNLTGEFNRIGNLAAAYMLTLKDLEGEELRNVFNRLEQSWKPGPGSAWDDALEMLDTLENTYEEFEQSISWMTQSLQDVKSKIASARGEMEFKQEDIDSAVQFLDLILPQIGDDNLSEPDEGDDNDVVNDMDKVETPGDDETPGNEIEINDDERDVDDIGEDEIKLTDEELQSLNVINQKIAQLLEAIDKDIEIVQNELK